MSVEICHFIRLVESPITCCDIREAIVLNGATYGGGIDTQKSGHLVSTMMNLWWRWIILNHLCIYCISEMLFIDFCQPEKALYEPGQNLCNMLADAKEIFTILTS